MLLLSITLTNSMVTDGSLTKEVHRQESRKVTNVSDKTAVTDATQNAEKNMACDETPETLIIVRESLRGPVTDASMAAKLPKRCLLQETFCECACAEPVTDGCVPARTSHDDSLS